MVSETPVVLRLTTTGVVRYGMKVLGNPEGRWFMVIDCDPEIGRYARHLYGMAHHHCRSLQRPAWKEHITVVRDEEPSEAFKPLWGLRNDEIVTLDVDMTVLDNGVYYWLPVRCDEALDIREGLGLPRQPIYPLHLSIGHNKDADSSA